MALPEEVIAKILSFLPIDELDNLRTKSDLLQILHCKESKLFWSWVLKNNMTNIDTCNDAILQVIVSALNPNTDNKLSIEIMNCIVMYMAMFALIDTVINLLGSHVPLVLKN